MTARLTADEVTAFLGEVFPQARGQFIAEAVGPLTARVRMPIGAQHLRPGDTISGPSMFWLADCAFYIALLANVGRDAKDAVTTNLNINFLRRPPPNDLIGEARILKLGRRLAVGEVLLYSQGDARPVAHATATYAIPG